MRVVGGPLFINISVVPNANVKTATMDLRLQQPFVKRNPKKIAACHINITANNNKNHLIKNDPRTTQRIIFEYNSLGTEQLSVYIQGTITQ